MCQLRQVKYIYAECAHSVGMPDELIECESRFCKFSVNHPEHCGPDCGKNCWQYRQFPQQYDVTHEGPCPICALEQDQNTQEHK